MRIHWTMRRSRQLGSALALAALVAGCRDSPAPAEPEAALLDGSVREAVASDPVASHRHGGNHGNVLSDAVGGQLARLRRATSRFHIIVAAERAGYAVLVTHPTSGAACLEDPALGGMGRHYLDPELLDGEVEIESPEVVIYEPAHDGRLRLVAVEYVVPFTIRGPDQPPPALFGRAFEPNHTFGLWALHAWVWKHNPSGAFAAWNPTVTCAHDDAVRE